MPPKSKTQLTENERKLLAFWLKQKGGFGLVLDYVGNDSINQIAAVYLGLATDDTHGSKHVAKLDSVPSSVIERLLHEGVVIRELVAGSYCYDVRIPDYIGYEKGVRLLESLKPLSNNIIWLHLSGLDLQNKDLKTLASMQNPTKLRLDNNALTDDGIESLSELQSLEVLNLYGNTLTNDCLVSLSRNESLKTVYVWQTGITQKNKGNIEFVN